jgi:hypothetical protein
LTLVLGASAQEAEELLHQISLILSKIEQGIFMDKTIKKVIDLSEQRAETYRYWRSRSSSERFEATYRHSVDLYRQKLSCRMEKDQRDLLRVFNERKVKYLVVGGMRSRISPNRASQRTWIFF